MNKRVTLSIFVFLLSAIIVWVVIPKSLPSIKIGVLHSMSGTMALSERSVADVTIAAFKEINDEGGILGHQIQPVLADGKSNPIHFAHEAQRLIEKEGIKAIFGCWTSSSRKEVKPIVERYRNLLFYPVQYEGFEASPNIIYLGQTPNQQILPAIKYSIDHFGKNVFLIGSDYIYPRTANLYIKDIGSLIGIKIKGERYIPLGGADFKRIVQVIKSEKPDVIFNTLNGDSNLYFFRELDIQGIHASDIPVVSFSIGETENRKMSEQIPHEALMGHYASWSYFSTLASEENIAFKRFLKKYGINTTPTDAMEAAYNGVQIYKQAVEECGSFVPSVMQQCIPMQGYNGAGGVLYINPTNNHGWKANRIGKINRSMGFDIVYESIFPIRPENYPDYRSVEEWNTLLRRLR